MKHEREFDTSYFQNPHSLGYELLPHHHVAEGDGVDGVGGQPEASPLLSLQSSNPYDVFRVSPPPHHKVARGGYI
jgi:hypothetical protein